MNWLVELDREFFVFLNGLGGPALDDAMLWITYKTSWYPFYALIISFIFLKFKRERWFVFLAIALLITGTELTASALFKPMVGRLRPCHDPELKGIIRMVVDGCGGKFGFFSAHASNTFGIATFIWLLLRDQGKLKWIGVAMLMWAAVVSYSRVYVGVHFPLDIFVGAICGILFAFLIHKVYVFSCRKVLYKS